MCFPVLNVQFVKMYHGHKDVDMCMAFLAEEVVETI